MTVLSADNDIDILITETEIAARTTQLARMISDHYSDTEQLVVVGCFAAPSFSSPIWFGGSIFRSRWIS